MNTLNSVSTKSGPIHGLDAAAGRSRILLISNVLVFLIVGAEIYSNADRMGLESFTLVLGGFIIYCLSARQTIGRYGVLTPVFWLVPSYYLFMVLGSTINVGLGVLPPSTNYVFMGLQLVMLLFLLFPVKSRETYSTLEWNFLNTPMTPYLSSRIGYWIILLSGVVVLGLIVRRFYDFFGGQFRLFGGQGADMLSFEEARFAWYDSIIYFVYCLSPVILYAYVRAGRGTKIFRLLSMSYLMATLVIELLFVFRQGMLIILLSICAIETMLAIPRVRPSFLRLSVFGLFVLGYYFMSTALRSAGINSITSLSDPSDLLAQPLDYFGWRFLLIHTELIQNLIDYFPKSSPFLWGASYFKVGFASNPNVYLAGLTARLFQGYGSAPPSVYGEAYANFSYSGMLIVMVFLVWAMRWSSYWLLTGQKTDYKIVLMAVSYNNLLIVNASLQDVVFNAGVISIVYVSLKVLDLRNARPVAGAIKRRLGLRLTSQKWD